jgi:hypothetical protein
MKHQYSFWFDSLITCFADKPAPCSMFYLTERGCTSGSTCKYGHDYLLGAHHYEEMRVNAKKGPCPYINKGPHTTIVIYTEIDSRNYLDESCPWGEDDCIHG